jgi:hypothetical protein
LMARMYLPFVRSTLSGPFDNRGTGPSFGFGFG